MTLLPLSRADNNNDNDGEGDDVGDGDGDQAGAHGHGGLAEGGDVVEGLERRALRLEHHMTAKECVGADMAEKLLPFFSSRCV